MDLPVIEGVGHETGEPASFLFETIEQSENMIPYLYGTNFDPLEGFDTDQPIQTKLLEMDSDSFFILDKISTSRIDATRQGDRNPQEFSVTILRQASNQNMQNVRQPLGVFETIYGGSGYLAPKKMAPMIIFSPKSRLLYQAKNISTANTALSGAQIVLSGFKTTNIKRFLKSI